MTARIATLRAAWGTSEATPRLYIFGHIRAELGLRHMRSLLCVVLLAACGGDPDSRHIVDGQGSGAGASSTVQFTVASGNSPFATASFQHSVTTLVLPPECTQVAADGCEVTVCPTVPTYSVSGSYDD